MITENNIKRLEKLVAKYAYADYLVCNPPGKRKIRKDGTIRHEPYSLSEKTNQARDMLALARKENLTENEENIVKAYLLKAKMLGEEDGI